MYIFGVITLFKRQNNNWAMKNEMVLIRLQSCVASVWEECWHDNVVSPFNCYLSVVLSLEKADYPENYNARNWINALTKLAVNFLAARIVPGKHLQDLNDQSSQRLTSSVFLFQSSGAVCKSRWPSWAPVPNKPTVSVDVKQHSTKIYFYRAQELCESRGGRPGLPSLISLRFLWT